MMSNQNMLHEDLTEEILNSFFYVHNRLGFGFLEKVYENSLMSVLQRKGLNVQQQVPMNVYFEDVRVGEYFADLVVNDLVILELKAADNIVEGHEYQLINYLRASQIEVGLILNFGEKPTFKRKIFTNDRKPDLLDSPH